MPHPSNPFTVNQPAGTTGSPEAQDQALEDFYGTDILFTDDFPVGPQGDYLEVSGKDNLYQAVLRRLLVKPGEYAYRPDYGVGVGSYVKRAGSKSVKDELGRKIVEQLMKDPRIEKVLEVRVDNLVSTDQGQGIKILVRVKVLGQERRFQPFEFWEVSK
jgi:phage baseplate assembly protein W